MEGRDLRCTATTHRNMIHLAAAFLSFAAVAGLHAADAPAAIFNVVLTRAGGAAILMG